MHLDVVHTQLPENASTLGVPMLDASGRSVLVVMAKYTFAVSPLGVVTRAEDPAEINLVDTPLGEDTAKSGIRKPSQLFDTKPGTDVVLLGHAHPQANDPGATRVDVTLRAGRLTKTVRASGLRVWQAGLLSGLKPGPARALREPVALVYENAWGGTDASDPEKVLVEPRNPIGTGVTRDPKSLVDRPAAALEDPAHPIDGRGARPAAFSPIHRHWQPRAAYAGTFDEDWHESRMPLMPADFDTRYHVCVPPDQWSEIPLRSDEQVEVLGVRPEGPWRFQLPRVAVGFSSFLGGERTEHKTHLDTMVIDADALRVEVTWRAAVLLPRKHEMLERVLVFEKEVV